MRFCWVPPGKFMMGSPKDEIGRANDETQPLVKISRGFWLAKYPCTQGEWFDVVGNRPSFHGKTSLLRRMFIAGEDAATKRLDLPVENVSWYDICRNKGRNRGFLERVNERAPDGWRFDLPTEAQWEYGCRAGTTSALNNGKEITTTKRSECRNLDEVAWYVGNSRGQTRPVGSKMPNAWGLHDMHGNVWEWCADWYGEYGEEAVRDPEGPTEGAHRVNRGGSWYFLAVLCRSAFRGWSTPGFRNNRLGFRPALVPSGQEER